MLKKLYIILMMIGFTTYPAFALDSQGVLVTLESQVYTAEGMLVDVSLKFEDTSLYHDDVLFSYHILDANGEILRYENERQTIAMQQDGTADIQMMINCAAMPELDGVDIAQVQFDLVDQTNVYWFSDRGLVQLTNDTPVLFQQDQLLAAASAAENASVAQDPQTEKKFEPVSIVLNALAWIGLLALLICYRRKKKGRDAGDRPKVQDNYEQNDALKESRFSDRTIVIALAVIGLAIPFVLYWKPMLNNNTVVNNDGLGFYYSLQYLSDLLRKGVFPLWNPYLAGGMPQGIMIGSVGVYPLNWLTALFPVAVQLPLYLGLHLAIGACFMFRYLRKLSCSHIVSLAVSLMYIFTVHMGGYRKEHMPLLVTAIYAPAILYFAEQYLQNKKLKWLFSCAAAMALQFLGGFLQYAIYSDIMVFLYLLTAGFHYKIPFSRMLKHGVLWLLSYFGMIMGALLGTAQFMLLLTGDSGQQMLFENFKGMSLHPIKLLMTIVPEIFGQDVWASFVDLNYSSGMDAELTFGAATICVLLASLQKSPFQPHLHTV